MQRKILIIEDNENDMVLIKRCLGKSGYTDIAFADEAEKGIEAAVNTKPDLVISDTMLPGSSGFEVCRRIREACGSQAPKIIIMTGSIDAIDAVRARQVGADDYCVKTSDYAPLIEAVKNTIQSIKEG